MGNQAVNSMLDEKVRISLSDWAISIDAAEKLWLFGSRARGDHRPDSDHDFALELKPKDGNTDWALADFIIDLDEWKASLRKIVCTDVNLVPIRADLPMKFDPRVTLIWARQAEGR